MTKHFLCEWIVQDLKRKFCQFLVTTTEPIYRVLKIKNGGNACFQHSKTVTKPKFELQQHLAPKQVSFKKKFFYLKIAGPIIFKMAFKNLCSPYGARPWKIPCGFCNSLPVMSAQVFVCAQSPLKKTLHCICFSPVPLKATYIIKVPF